MARSRGLHWLVDNTKGNPRFLVGISLVADDASKLNLTLNNESLAEQTTSFHDVCATIGVDRHRFMDTFRVVGSNVPGSMRTLNEKLKLGGPLSNSFPLGMAIGFGGLPLAAWLLREDIAVILAYVALFAPIMIRRATSGFSSDMSKGKNLTSVILARLLFDRSYF
jgi:hypothetical protein